jgi:hypothetical protein
MKPVLIFSSTKGVNTRVDEARLALDFETGECELAEGVNITIDQSGRIYRRTGYSLVIAGEYHSVFCDNGPCFVVHDRANDAAIMQVASDLSLSGVRSPLTKGLRMSFWQDGPTTYYSNGKENGIIVDGISAPWPDHTDHVGPETSRVFFPAPAGQHLSIAHGRMWIFEGNVLWYSEPFAYGKFDKSRGFYQFHTPGRVVRGVTGGLWVSDSQSIMFFDGTNPTEMVLHRKASYPLLEWSDAIITVNAAEYGYEWSPGQSVVAVSSEGLCLLGPGGEFDNIGKQRILMPPGANEGATLIRGDNAIHSAWC